jgi:hypothetical protein
LIEERIRVTGVSLHLIVSCGDEQADDLFRLARSCNEEPYRLEVSPGGERRTQRLCSALMFFRFEYRRLVNGDLRRPSDCASHGQSRPAIRRRFGFAQPVQVLPCIACRPCDVRGLQPMLAND